MESELLAGRYRLVAKVGKGATGQVWQGYDVLLERTVAIKIVDLEGAKDPAMAERFRREGKAIANVSNDAVVRIFDTGTDEARGWLVMEYLSGPNVNTLVKEQGPVSYPVGMPLLAKVADGLQAAHNAGITHRDVKPANIVLDAPPEADGTRQDLLAHPEKGRPVLVDFGIARIVDEAGTQLTRPATAIGTAAYMSPEQARGQDVGPASDVYSLGCVAYHLLLGRPPFLADSSIAVAHAQAFDTPVPLSELSPDAPPALDALVARMLAKDPAARPTARQLARELRAITANPQLRASGPSVAETAVLTPTAATQLLPPPTAAIPATSTAPIAAEPTRPVTAAPPSSPTPAPVETEGGRGFRHAGRWLVALLVIGLAAALIYSWVSRGQNPEPSSTVTMTTTTTPSAGQTTRPATSSAPATTVAIPTAVQTSSAPAPSTATQQPTTSAPPATTGAPTQATTRPATTAPTTTQAGASP